MRRIFRNPSIAVDIAAAAVAIGTAFLSWCISNGTVIVG